MVYYIYCTDVHWNFSLKATTVFHIKEISKRNHYKISSERYQVMTTLTWSESWIFLSCDQVSNKFIVCHIGSYAYIVCLSTLSTTSFCISCLFYFSFLLPFFVYFFMSFLFNKGHMRWPGWRHLGKNVQTCWAKYGFLIVWNCWRESLGPVGIPHSL